MKARNSIVGLLALALSLAAAGPAGAEVVVKGTGEPAFTSSANNTQWVEWSNNGNYRVEFNHFVNGGTATVVGPYPVAKTGSMWVNWAGVKPVPLAEGSTYTICGFGRWDDGTGIYFPDFSTSCGDADRRGLRASTTIDRTAPSIGLALAGGAAATKSAALPLHIDFADNLAGPFPANFLCLQYGGTSGICDSAAGYKYLEQPSCSQPKAPGKSTAFECTVDVGTGATPAPDGTVWVCAMAADASIPDNPYSDDQRASSTAANRSAPTCDSVMLDRVAPALAIDAPATAAVGQLVSLGATASDAGSGLSGAYTWTGADGTGASASRTFTSAGTYEVSVRTADAAGNEAVAKKVITVSAAPSTPGNPGAEPTPAPTVTPAPSAAATTLRLSAPRTVKLAQRRVAVTLTASAGGRATVALVRSGRLVAQGAKRIAAPGTSAYALKLPRKAKAGTYALRVTFTPDGGGTAITKAARVKLTGKRARATASAAGAAQIAPAAKAVATGGRVLPDGRYHGPAGRRFTP